MAFFGPQLCVRQDFRAIFGHQNRVLELCAWLSVFGSNGPAVCFVQASKARPGVDHRLDGKGDSRKKAIRAALAIGEVRDRRILVEHTPQAVSDIFADDGKAAFVGFWDNGVTDLAHRTARRECMDRQVKTIERTLGHRQRFVADLADHEGLALIAIPSIHNRRDVHIDNVAFAKDVFAGDSVADHVVDAGAAAFGVTLLVTKRGGAVSFFRGPLHHKIIDLLGRDSGDDVGTEEVHQLGIGLPGMPHRITFRGGQNDVFVFLEHLLREHVKRP